MTTKKLREMIRMLRDERIAYTTLSVSAGAITLDGVVDLKTDSKPAKVEPRETMFERYAGDLARQPATGKPSDMVPEEALVE